MVIEFNDVCKSYSDTKAAMDGCKLTLSHINLTLLSGRRVGLIGESGAGKTTIAKLLMRGIQPTSGHIFFNGSDIADFDSVRIKEYRRRVQMTFQDARGSLDPRMTIRDSLAEPVRSHFTIDIKSISGYIEQLLFSVGLDQKLLDRYPKELSEGQCQRVGLARAIALQPGILILDEPVSSLDAFAKANVLQLLLKIYNEHNVGFLLISHDLAPIRLICDDVYVIYKGRFVESGSVVELFQSPKHPYTIGLLEADAWAPKFKG